MYTLKQRQFVQTSCFHWKQCNEMSSKKSHSFAMGSIPKTKGCKFMECCYLHMKPLFATLMSSLPSWKMWHAVVKPANCQWVYNVQTCWHWTKHLRLTTSCDICKPGQCDICKPYRCWCIWMRYERLQKEKVTSHFLASWAIFSHLKSADSCCELLVKYVDSCLPRCERCINGKRASLRSFSRGLRNWRSVSLIPWILSWLIDCH